MDTIKTSEIIDATLHDGNRALGHLLKSDVLFIKAPMRPPVDDAVRDEIEEIRAIDARARRLSVVVETLGGFVETVERIVSVFRKHYKYVDFIVPNYAYSAGTILVLSGDEIYMDYYSILGPIDPQLEMGNNGELMPGMGYLAKFDELAKTINASADPTKTRAEMSFLINKFDPAMLFFIEQSIEHSKSLLREWLPKYKFRSWKKKETSGARVTKRDRQERADQIASALGDASKWHSHGRGISIRELGSDDIKLKVNNYGDNESLYGNISHYHGLLIDYMGKLGITAGLHSKRGLRRLA